MNPNPPIKGHALLHEGGSCYFYSGCINEPPKISYGCACGRRPDETLSINATKRWHRAHKDELRAVAS